MVTTHTCSKAWMVVFGFDITSAGLSALCCAVMRAHKCTCARLQGLSTLKLLEDLVVTDNELTSVEGLHNLLRVRCHLPHLPSFIRR